MCWAQAFHTLYHTDESVLLGAPTGSGKTISAELAMLRVFNAHPGKKVIYIAPLKVCIACTCPLTYLACRIQHCSLLAARLVTSRTKSVLQCRCVVVLLMV